MPSYRSADTHSALPPLRDLPERPDAAARRGSSAGRRNASAGNGCGNGGSPPPWAYQRRISELGPPESRSKQFRHQHRRAVAYLAYEAAALRPIDVNVADVLLDFTHGGTRDYKTTESQIAARLPTKNNGMAVSKRVASDALDRLRAAGLLDWDHGTTEDFYDHERRTMLNGRWQGPPTFRLLIPKALRDHIEASEAEARTETFRRKNQQHRRSSTTSATQPITDREQQRRQAQSNAAALANAASTTTFQQGVDSIRNAYDEDPELLTAALQQFQQSWRPRGPT